MKQKNVTVANTSENMDMLIMPDNTSFCFGYIHTFFLPKGKQVPVCFSLCLDLKQDTVMNI